MTRRLPRSGTAVSAVRVRYPDCYGRLWVILRYATDQGFVIHDVQTEILGGRKHLSPRTPHPERGW